MFGLQKKQDQVKRAAPLAVKVMRPEARAFTISIFILIFISISQKTFALDNSNYTQMHVRTGMISGGFSSSAGGSSSGSGALTGGTSAPKATPLVGGIILDLEYERFVGRKSSIIFRTIIDSDSAHSRVQYLMNGIGQRYYLGADAMTFDVSGDKTTIHSVPKRRYYLGWDFGLAHMIVDTSVSTFPSFSILLDFSANAGFIYQMTRSIGLELQLGYGFGYGFSNAAGTATTMRILFGTAFAF